MLESSEWRAVLFGSLGICREEAALRRPLTQVEGVAGGTRTAWARPGADGVWWAPAQSPCSLHAVKQGNPSHTSLLVQLATVQVLGHCKAKQDTVPCPTRAKERGSSEVHSDSMSCTCTQEADNPAWGDSKCAKHF